MTDRKVTTRARTRVSVSVNLSRLRLEQGTLPTARAISAPTPPAVQASRKLLRVIAALSTQVDPIDGGRASTMRGLAEEGKEVLEQSGAGFPDVRQSFLLL